MFQGRKECPELWAQNGTDDSSACLAPPNSHREVTVFLKEVLSHLPEQHEENSGSAQGTASPLLPPRPACSTSILGHMHPCPQKLPKLSAPGKYPKDALTLGARVQHLTIFTLPVLFNAKISNKICLFF